MYNDRWGKNWNDSVVIAKKKNLTPIIIKIPALNVSGITIRNMPHLKMA